MENQKNIINKGGTMRLGSWECEIEKGSLRFMKYIKSKSFLKDIDIVGS